MSCDCKCQKFIKIKYSRVEVPRTSRIEMTEFNPGYHFLSTFNGKDYEGNSYKIVFDGSAQQTAKDERVYEGSFHITVLKLDRHNHNKFNSSSFTVYSITGTDGLGLSGTYYDDTTGNKLVIKKDYGTVYLKI